MGVGAYTATVMLQPNPTPDPSCSGGPCVIHQTAPGAYEIFYKYTVTSDGVITPKLRRRVTLSRTFSVQLRLQSFPLSALFPAPHSTPARPPLSSTPNPT